MVRSQVKMRKVLLDTGEGWFFLEGGREFRRSVFWCFVSVEWDV